MGVEGQLAFCLLLGTFSLLSAFPPSKFFLLLRAALLVHLGFVIFLHFFHDHLDSSLFTLPLPLASASTPVHPRQRPRAVPGACVVTGWTKSAVAARAKVPVRRAKEWMLVMKEARELKKAQMAGVAA